MRRISSRRRPTQCAWLQALNLSWLVLCTLQDDSISVLRYSKIMLRSCQVTDTEADVEISTMVRSCLIQTICLCMFSLLCFFVRGRSHGYVTGPTVEVRARRAIWHQICARVAKTEVFRCCFPCLSFRRRKQGERPS